MKFYSSVSWQWNYALSVGFTRSVRDRISWKWSWETAVDNGRRRRKLLHRTRLWNTTHRQVSLSLDWSDLAHSSNSIFNGPINHSISLLLYGSWIPEVVSGQCKHVGLNTLLYSIRVTHSSWAYYVKNIKFSHTHYRALYGQSATESGGEHLIAAHDSFISPERMKGWVDLVG